MAEQSTEPQAGSTPAPIPCTDKPKTPRVKLFRRARSARELQDDILQKCYLDPREFVKYFLGVAPTHQQNLMLRDMAPTGAHVSVASGRGIGKSTVMAWLAMWHTLFRTDCKTVVTSPSASQLSDVVWPEIAKWHKILPSFLRNDLVILRSRVVHARDPKNRFVVARTARKDNPEALQGIRATNTLYMIDEASGVDEQIFITAKGSLTNPQSRILLCSNPTRAEGFFFDSHHKAGIAEQWVKHNFSSIDSTLVERSWIEEMHAYGEDHPYWKILVLGQFPSASADILIPYHLIERALSNATIPAGLRIAGLDIARFGDDRSALVIRQGNAVTHISFWSGYSIPETVKRALSMAPLFDIICVDEIGVGGGAVDLLSLQGQVRVVPVNVSRSSTDPQFARLRDQLWFATRDWLAQSDPVAFLSQEHKHRLAGELAAVRFEYNQSGKIKVESKEDMKTRLHYSPDIADALCMTFAAPLSAYGGIMGLNKAARTMGAVFGI